MTRFPVSYVNTVLEVYVEVLKRVGVTGRLEYWKNSERSYNWSMQAQILVDRQKKRRGKCKNISEVASDIVAGNFCSWEEQKYYKAPTLGSYDLFNIKYK